MAKKILNTADILKIKDALEDVTYTFHDTDILYKQTIESLDRFQEDRELATNDITIKGFLEEVSNTMIKKYGGAIAQFDAKITFNTRDLEVAGLLVADGDDSFHPVFKVGDDYLYIGGLQYRIEKVYNDGRFDKQPILTIVFANLVSS